MIHWVLYSASYGGFGFSREFEAVFAERFPEKCELLESSSSRRTRTDEDVIALVRELGLHRSSGPCARLEAFPVHAELLSAVRIEEYDGLETPHVDEQRLFARMFVELMESDGGMASLEATRAKYARVRQLLADQNIIEQTHVFEASPRK